MTISARNIAKKFDLKMKRKNINIQNLGKLDSLLPGVLSFVELPLGGETISGG